MFLHQDQVDCHSAHHCHHNHSSAQGSSIYHEQRQRVPVHVTFKCYSDVEDQEYDTPRMNADEALERIAAMKRQEENYVCCNYLENERNIAAEQQKFNVGGGVTQAGSDFGSASVELEDCALCDSIDDPVDEECRLAMCKWCYQVTDFFNFRRETGQIAMSYVDRFLSSRKNRDYLNNRSTYQLCVIAAIHVAIKANEPAELDVKLLMKLGRNCFTEKQITVMESILLQTLSWRLNPPTSWLFVQHMIAMIPTQCIDNATRKSILGIAQSQCELSLFQYELSVTHRPSMIGFAAILNGIDGMDPMYISHLVDSSFLHVITRELAIDPLCCSRSLVNCRRKLLMALTENRGANYGGGSCDTLSIKCSDRLGRNISQWHNLNGSTMREHVECRSSPKQVGVLSYAG